MKSIANNAEYKQILLELETIREQRQSIEANIASLKSNMEEIAKKIDIKERELPDRFPPVSSLIKDELILIGFLVLYIGLLATDSYYSYFGIKYQLLKLPSFHIIYKGLTVLMLSPAILIPYIITILVLGIDFYATKYKWIKYLHFRNIGIYLILLSLLAITYPIAMNAGINAAKSDMQEANSSLPIVIQLTTDKEDIGKDRHYRLLMADSDYVIVFRALETDNLAQSPHIKRYLKGDVHVLETNY